MELQKIVETLLKKIVTDPEKVEVQAKQGEKGLVFEARVAKQDMGKVIGRKGKTIEALRSIVYACGVKKDQRCMLQLIEEEEEEEE